MLKIIIISIIGIWSIILYCLWKYEMFKKYLSNCDYSIEWTDITLFKHGDKRKINFCSDNGNQAPLLLKITNPFVYIMDWGCDDYRATIYFRILPLIWLELGTNCW